MCSVAAVLKYMELGDAADCQTCLFHQYASGKVLGTMRLDECQNCSETLCGVLNSFVEHAKLLPGNAWDAPFLQPSVAVPFSQCSLFRI